MEKGMKKGMKKKEWSRDCFCQKKLLEENCTEDLDKAMKDEKLYEKSCWKN